MSYHKFSLRVWVSIFILVGLFLFVPKVHAKSSYYKELNVDYYLNEDSTMDVSEEMIINYTGEFHGTYRSITLQDDGAYQRCKNNPDLQCGGFDFMYLKSVIGKEGKELKEGDYEINLQSVETSGGYEDRVEIRYEFSPEGKYFNGEDLRWVVNYKVYGSIGYFDDYDLFYWDTAFEDRYDTIRSMTIRIHFPSNFNFNGENDLKVFNDSHYTFENGLLTITVDNPIPDLDPNTVLVKFPKNIVKEPATLKLIPKVSGFSVPLLGADYDLIIDGKKIYNQGNEYKGLPPGQQSLQFESSGYEPVTVDVDLPDGGYKEVEVEANPKPFMIALFFGVFLCNCLGFLMIPFGFFYPIYRWRNSGRDKGGKKTIVPWFKPPEEISPALLGSLKDEKVDMVDISSTIINVAYKGYIKIKELDKKGKNFEFEKLKDFSDLNKEEERIINDIFDGKDKIKTSELKNKFYKKISGIQDTLYDEMVSKKYFEKRPDKVRNNNAGLGVMMIVFPLVVFIGLAVITGGVALLFATLPFVSFLIMGVLTLILSNYMPAKTNLGTEILEKVKGFRMYLHTAERFRMQKLTPEMFEKFLSYAVVFGIEKDWANKFKDIYKGQPDWYEGYDSSRTWTPIYLANSLSKMNTVTTRVISSKPQSSSSGWSGGGWSGGGGFSGGFSGGGGGGGGGGSW